MEQMTLILPQMLNEKQAAHILSVSVAALRRWRRERRGPQFTRLERCVRYETRAIKEWIAENTTEKQAFDCRLDQLGQGV